MDQFWPGPLTIIFEASREIPSWLLRDDETIALRISSHPWIERFLSYYGKPIISTSANPSGEPSARTVAEVETYFPKGLSYVIDGGELQSTKSSTIISLKGASIQVLRKGDITLDQIQLFAHGTH